MVQPARHDRPPNDLQVRGVPSSAERRAAGDDTAAGRLAEPAGPDDLAFPPDLLWRTVAVAGQALGTSSRLHLLAILSGGPRTVSELAEISGQAVAAASAQLQVLKRAGLVVGDREGRSIRYRHASPAVSRLVAVLRETAEALLPSVREVVDDVLRDPDTLAPLSVDELEAELDAGRVVLLDVRTEREFIAGHLPGAINVPSSRLAERLDEVRRAAGEGARVVAYCRGPYCVTAVNAVQALRRHGVDAARVELGPGEWEAAGRPLATAGSRETRP